MNYLVAFIIDLFAFLVIYAGYNSLKTTIDSKNWPETYGEVIDYEFRTNRPEHLPAVRVAVLILKYTFNGKDYYTKKGSGVGRTLNQLRSFSSKSGLDSELRKILSSQYPLGTKISIYYNPRKPRKVVFFRGDDNYFEALIASIISLIFFGSGFLVNSFFDEPPSNTLDILLVIFSIIILVYNGFTVKLYLKEKRST
jgi:hypothetical protein